MFPPRTNRMEIVLDGPTEPTADQIIADAQTAKIKNLFSMRKSLGRGWCQQHGRLQSAPLYTGRLRNRHTLHAGSSRMR